MIIRPLEIMNQFIGIWYGCIAEMQQLCDRVTSCPSLVLCTKYAIFQTPLWWLKPFLSGEKQFKLLNYVLQNMYIINLIGKL